MSDDKLPCADCRLYGCPDDGPDRAYNRARRHCDCHGAYRQPESAHRPAPQDEAADLDAAMESVTGLPAHNRTVAPDPERCPRCQRSLIGKHGKLEALPAAPATSVEFGERLRLRDDLFGVQLVSLYLDAVALQRCVPDEYLRAMERKVDVVLAACAGADSPQPGELARLRALQSVTARQRDDALLILSGTGDEVLRGEAVGRLKKEGLL